MSDFRRYQESAKAGLFQATIAHTFVLPSCPHTEGTTMLHLVAMLSTAAALLFADAASQPVKQPTPQPANQSVSMTTKAAQPDVKKLTLNTVEQGIVDGTNAQRARYGLPALAVDPALEQQARNHTAWMTNNRTMQHTSAPVAENIGEGQRSAEEIVSQWMNSSGHRANMLNSGYHRIGASAYTAVDGSIYWCEEFLP